ncbi:MAG TPA: L,D-transpeptidase family protein [Gaiellaceae bacterium]|nr:L,D-transpeptidase family protein [Gaiellaceae bacterium]
MKRLLAVLFVAAVSLGVAAPDAARKPIVIAPGVTVGGVHVGGMMSEAARTRVEAAFGRPLRLQFRDKRWRISPRYLGASAGIDRAVAEALRAAPRARVRLEVAAAQPRIRRYVNRLDRLFSRDAVDSEVVGVVGGRPKFTEAQTGLSVEREGMAAALTRALRSNNRRTPIELIVSTVEPKVTPANYGPVVIIHRGSNRLSLFDGPSLVRRFGVATGSSEYPTPLGSYSIATKQMNPWWIPPPDSEWAKDAEPIPPGPGNPLGTRWMGLTAPLVGIHGTPDAASIGYSASHGCIRMRVPEAEWLFSRVEVGTPVLIVPA